MTQPEISGPATPEEVAAVLAVLAARAEPAPDRYAVWRSVRRGALRRTATRTVPRRG